MLIVCLSTINSFSQVSRNLPNVATLYNPSISTIHPEYTIFHKNDSVSTIFVNINLNELNFIKLANRKFEAKLKLKFIFYESLESSNIIDSLSDVFTLSYMNFNQSVVLSVDMKMPKQNCKLVLISSDLYQISSNINFFNIDKSSKSSQNVALFDSSSNLPVFEKFIKPYKNYYIKSKSFPDSFLIEKYKIDENIAAPPYSNASNTLHNVFITKYKVYNDEYLKFEQNFVYKIISLTDSSSNYYTCFDEYFPSVLFANQMFKPLKYLTSASDFENIVKQKNKKLAVDNFWLSRNGDKSIARKQIKIYYNRVVYSNNKFSSTKQGWTTDRGMIYIIFGPPSLLYVGDDFEEWVYYDKTSGEKLNFIFENQQTTPFSYDYVLKRNQSYVNNWQPAIDAWNKGLLYIF